MRGGLLVEEFDQIFADIFLRNSKAYRQILEMLCSAPKEMGQLKRELTGDGHGRIAEYLRELELAGFIARDYTLNLKTGNDARLSRFRLKDNYVSGFI